MTIIFKAFITFFFLVFLWLAPAVAAQNESTQTSETIYSAEIIRTYTSQCNDESADTCVVAEVKILLPNNTTEEGVVTLRPENQRLENYENFNSGDRILIREFTVGDEIRYGFVSADRSFPYWILALFFIGIVVVIAGWKGVRSLVALSLSSAVILLVMLPLMVDYPQNILLIGVITAFGIYTINQFLGHGIQAQGFISIFSGAISFSIVLGISLIFSSLFKVSGFGDEGSIFLENLLPAGFNIADIFIVGTLLGLAGAVDDVNSTQTSSIAEIAEAQPSITFSELYKRGTNIGTNHLVSIINTLFLAYFGAALPTILVLVLIADEQLAVLLSRDDITEEILRTIFASSGLLIAIPLTTAISSMYFIRRRPGWLPSWVPFSKTR